MSAVYVKATCHCGLNTFKVAFTASSLPLAPSMCHCSTCRHNTGQMSVHCSTIFGAPLSLDRDSDSKEEQAAEFKLQGLLEYKPSERLTRYFCSKCSAYMLSKTGLDEGEQWSVSSGVLEKVEGIVKVGCHTFLEDTLDGGIADHYCTLNGVELPRYKRDASCAVTMPTHWKADNIIKVQEHSPDSNDKLAAYCHCKTISLTLTPVTHITDPENPWWPWLVPPKNDKGSQGPIRYLGVHCVCRSCRLCSGGLIQSWVYIPRANILDARTSKPVVLVPKDGETRMIGLSQYESSLGTFRESCGQCGATVFFWKKEREADVLDVAPGLLDESKEGARAERWFAWRREVEAPEDRIDQPGLAALEDSLRMWQDIY